METSAPPRRELSSEKATRIVEAMRDSVARRGAAASTFEQVAKQAGVSRGLLHYYFGTKERLLVEVVRRDSDLRLEALNAALAPARSADEVLDVLVVSLNQMIEHDPQTFLLIFELFSAGRRNPDIHEELGHLFSRLRERLAEILEAKQEQGVLKLRFSSLAVSSYLCAIADGVALQVLSCEGEQVPDTMAAHISAARHLLTAD